MGKGSKERAKERRERRITEISLLRTMSYSNQRWWTSETVAVVTGGNRGIGFEIIRQLAGHGMTVVLTSRDTEVGIEAVKVLQEADLLVDFHQLDIVDPSGVNFDVGSENSVEHAEQVINTNYYGTKNLTEAMIPLMKPSSFGARIVNVSSRLGRLNGRRNRIEDVSLREQLSNDDLLTEELIDNTLKTFLQQTKDGSWTLGGWPQNSTVYSMSKLAVNCYSRYLARKLCDRPEGEKISVNCFCPGWVKTAMTGWTGNVSVEIGADTGVWLALLAGQPVVNGKFFTERREIHF